MKSKSEIIEQTISSTFFRAINDAKVPGSSDCLSAMPLEEHGFVLNKKEFRNAVSLRYTKKLNGRHLKCSSI